jgi:hypothetical protein
VTAAAADGTSAIASLAPVPTSSAKTERINIADTAVVRAPGGTNKAATAISRAIQATAALIP